MINSINELEQRLISPLENEKFIDLIFKVNYPPTTGGTKFSEQFNYNLNSQNKDINYFYRVTYNFIRLKSKMFYNNLKMMNYEDVKKIVKGITKDKLLQYFDKLQNMSLEEYNEMIQKGDISRLHIYKTLVDKDVFNSNGWYYFKSKKTAPNREEKISKANVKHRLYLTMDVSQLYKFAFQLANKLE